MNYEQKYKEALEQAKQELEACGSLDCDAARQIFRLFPELQSIKNEKIKTNIIKLLRFVRDIHHQYSDECNEAIEWLKKQSNDITCLEDNWIREELIHFLETCQDSRFVGNRKRDEWIEWLEKQNKPQVRTGIEWDNTIDDACNHRYAEEYAHGEYCHEQSFKWGFQEGVDWLEKHPICDMPKIKFKVGD